MRLIPALFLYSMKNKSDNGNKPQAEQRERLRNYKRLLNRENHSSGDMWQAEAEQRKTAQLQVIVMQRESFIW